MDEKEFSNLIEKYQNGLLPDRERALVDKWFNSYENLEIQDKWTEKEKLTLRNKILEHFRNKDKQVYLNPSSSKEKIYLTKWYRIAAAILLMATASYVVWHYTSANEPEIVTLQASASGEINKVILPDGSIVWLKGTSTLTYPSMFTTEIRNVILKGEALFEVAKDPDHPFMIQCGELTTTVLGTSFNIKATDENIEVVVLTGKVSLTSTTDKQGLVVLPNEKAVYHGNQKQLTKIGETPAEEKIATIENTEYRMNFWDTQMKEVIQRIEKKFNVNITFSNPDIRNCMVTADFTDQSLDRTLKMISEAIGLQYVINGKEITLTGTGCELIN